MSITRSTHPAFQLEGLKEIFGASYAKYEDKYKKIFDFFAPKGLFVFAILTDMPLKIDVCACDQISLFLIKFVSFCLVLSQSNT